MAEFYLGLHFAEITSDEGEGEDEGNAEEGGEGVEGVVEAKGAEEKAAEEKADAFDRVFGACEDGYPFEKFGLAIIGDEQFDGALGAHFGEVFGDASEALDEHDEGDGEGNRPAGLEEGEGGEGDDL